MPGRMKSYSNIFVKLKLSQNMISNAKKSTFKSIYYFTIHNILYKHNGLIFCKRHISGRGKPKPLMTPFRDLPHPNVAKVSHVSFIIELWHYLFLFNFL